MTRRRDWNTNAWLIERARALVEHLEANAPPVIIAMDGAMIHHALLVAVPREYPEEITRRWVMDARQRFGLCQDCDTELNPVLSHAPLCPACEKKAEEDAKALAKEAGLEN